MKHIFKQLEEWGTNLKISEYKKAVFKLTIYYSLGVFVILIISNLFIYNLFSRDIQNDSFITKTHIEENEVFDDEIKENLFNVILFSDIFLAFITILISYFLSKKTLEPLERSHQKQKRFVADVSHELRTPMAVIKAGAEVLINKDRTLEEYKKFTEDSLEEVNKLITLSNNLLFLSKKDSQKKNFYKVSFSEILNTKIEQIKSYAKLKNISIDLNIEKDIYVYGIEEDLNRMILNLLKNSIDYNIMNGKVFISLLKKKNELNFVVKDSGIGIQEKEIEFIFDRFYKADSSRTDNNFSGTGLGLAIVKDIIEEHHGFIKVKSEVEKGSVFEISLPLSMN